VKKKKMCDEFYKALELGYIMKNKNGKFTMIKDFWDTECTRIEIEYCPYCGRKLYGRAK